MYDELKGFAILLTFFFVFSASTCEEKVEFGPSVDNFTKEKREKLGDLLKQTIADHPAEYPLLNRRSKRDSVITTYLQTLYDQVTQEIRQDRQSTPSNRWNPNRKWQVFVLHDADRYAFSLPAGHFYVSTGFLGSLSKGYEIYYLMAFEATNVSGRYLLDNLIAEYNVSTLLDIVEAQEVSTNPSLLDIVQALKRDLAFQDDVIKEIDRKTGELICETSIFDRLGIQPILEILSESSQEQYRDTRPSYANRVAYVNDLNIEGCGSIKSTGLYEKMVLKNLPK
ncbi:MAG: hypothetical protein AAGJ18_08525 [Bacteroidota bacterium]